MFTRGLDPSWPTPNSRMRGSQTLSTSSGWRRSQA